MASRRILKKSFNYLCDQIECDCIFLLQAQCLAEGHSKGAFLDRALQIRDDFGRRISHVEKGVKPQAFFKQWNADFSQAVNELYDELKKEFDQFEAKKQAKAEE